MHIDTCKNIRNGKEYVRHLLRVSYREGKKVKKRTIANLSHCSEEEIEAIRLALRHKEDLCELTNKESVDIEQGLSVGAVVVVYEVAKRLGIVSALGSSREGKLALWQVIARVISQGSRLSAVRLAKVHAGCEVIGMKEGFTEDDLYKNLKWISNKQEDIENRLFKKRYHEKKPSLYLYDVTSTYLEGKCNELGAFGYNRDKKQGKRQIVIGLMTDGTGVPVTIQVFKGNVNDPKTFGEQVLKVVNRFGGDNVTFVGDRGMIKAKQIAQLCENPNKQFYYITAITKAQIKSLLKKGSLQMSLFDQNLSEVLLEDEGIRLIIRRNPFRAEEIAKKRQDKIEYIKQQLLKQNKYLQQHPRASVAIACRKIEKKIEKLNLSWVSITVNERELSLKEDLSALNEIQKLDGCYAIKTNLPKKKADMNTVHTRYKDLALVEKAFRNCKTAHLEVRPVFVRLKENTKAHVFIVMLAYMIIQELAMCWKNLDISVKEGINQLTTLCAHTVTFKDSNVSFSKIPTPTPFISKLLKSAKITLPSAIKARTVIVDTRKSISK